MAARAKATAWLIALTLGLRQLWHGRYEITGDAISYLDIGGAFARGEWGAALNAYWSPLYAWVLGVVLRVAQPSPRWEFAIIAVFNYVVYLLALASFQYLLTAVMRYRHRRANANGAADQTFPDWAWIAVGYAAFVWSSLHLQGVWRVSPDMAVAACVYFATGLLLRIHSGDGSWQVMAALGLTLAVGYLVKSPMFPMAFVFLACAALAARSQPGAWARTAIAALTFLLVAGPYAFALSRAQGRATFGDAGRMNYAWDVNGVSRNFWEGGPAGTGIPKHPPRRIHEDPDVFEFARPIRATYPVWHDPSYWYDGVTPFFDLAGQWRLLDESLRLYRALSGQHMALLTGIFVSCFVGGMYHSIRNAMRQWPLWVPAGAALAMFALAGAEGRYIGPFVAVAVLAALSVPRLPDTSWARRVLVAVTFLALFSLGAQLLVDCLRPAPVQYGTNVNAEVARGLERIGIGRGDRVAQVRMNAGVYWARLAGVQIIAEISGRTAPQFWHADDAARRETLAAIARTGAKALVASRVPMRVGTDGWQRIGDTDFHVYLFR